MASASITTVRNLANKGFKPRNRNEGSILVPIDFSDPSRAALRFAADFARRYGGRIVLLSVIEPDRFFRFGRDPLIVTEKTFRGRVHSKLSDLAARHVGPELLGRVIVRSGVPFEQIVKAADVLKAELIIMATHGYTGIKHMLLGSTAERVIRFAPCPVMTIRAEAGGR